MDEGLSVGAEVILKQLHWKVCTQQGWWLPKATLREPAPLILPHIQSLAPSRDPKAHGIRTELHTAGGVGVGGWRMAGYSHGCSMSPFPSPPFQDVSPNLANRPNWPPEGGGSLTY